MPHSGPRNLLELTPPDQMQETQILVGYPQTPCSVLGDGIHLSAGNGAYRNKPVILQVAEPSLRGDPNSPAIILKEGIGVISIQFPVLFSGAVNRNLPVSPSVQATIGADPH